jgi:hypothetical protein
LERVESLPCRRNFVGQTLNELVYCWHDGALHGCGLRLRVIGLPPSVARRRPFLR